ncbi:outer membrane protein PagN [Geobacter sp. OR-1]|uniref:outer membrane protein n=1 Tax=Geobacter sp. OR-1 TaxID=1266765 RepID=UPI000544303F|nr:outer membrane beta-barrel protein [Geobacter sp. OR-1]GAM08850.1 outer membrane protein PagN [Geobacter sp. OR-1]
MKKSIIVVAAIATLAVPAISGAAPPKPGAYASAFLGVTMAQDTDVNTDVFASPPSFRDRVEFDPGVFLGGTGGYDFGYLRLEGELSYKHSEMKNITDRDTGVRYRSVDGNLGVFAFMANGFIDLHNDTPITPYFGGGIGVATLYLSDTTGIDNSGTRQTLYLKDNDSVFAYQVGAGMEVALNRRISLDLGYRYFGTARATFNEDWFQSTDLKYESHNVTAGVRFKF